MREGFEVGIAGSGHVGLGTEARFSFVGHRRPRCMEQDEGCVAELGLEACSPGACYEEATRPDGVDLPVQNTHPTGLFGRELS